MTHIHLHAKAQKKYEGKVLKNNTLRVRKHSLFALIDHLESTVGSFKWSAVSTEWGEYYDDTNYSSLAMIHKKKLVSLFLIESNPKTVWDVGANTGEFTRIAKDIASDIIAFDIDYAVLEKNYHKTKDNNETDLLPLYLDLNNPSPGLGWAHQERLSFVERGPADTLLVLALVHHLAISNNLPFIHIASFFCKICTFLIIEFVPKSDSQVQRLLRFREDIFSNYDQDNFEDSFGRFFLIQKKESIDDSQRTLYLMEKKVVDS